MIVCRPADSKFESVQNHVRFDLLKAAVLHDLSDPQVLGQVPRIVDACFSHLIRLSSQSECQPLHLLVYVLSSI